MVFVLFYFWVWGFSLETGLFLGHRMEVLIPIGCVGDDSETTEQQVNPVSFHLAPSDRPPLPSAHFNPLKLGKAFVS